MERKGRRMRRRDLNLNLFFVSSYLTFVPVRPSSPSLAAVSSPTEGAHLCRTWLAPTRRQSRFKRPLTQKSRRTRSYLQNRQTELR